MKAFVINLDRNPNRLAFMRGQLDGIGLAFERFPAVSGKDLTEVELKAVFAPMRSLIASKKRLSSAEIGCALSHLGCYREIIRSKESFALILEDDVRLCDRFGAALSRAQGFLDANRPQVLLFSGYGVEGAESLPEEIRVERSIWCADAYIITQAAAELILKANHPVITVADSFKRWHRRNGLELYRVLPSTAKQDDTKFASENKVLPKTNWLFRNLLWGADWCLWKLGRG